MSYVGWKDAKSALRYVEAAGFFAGSLQSAPAREVSIIALAIDAD
jgi:hypothetical protein